MRRAEEANRREEDARGENTEGRNKTYDFRAEKWEPKILIYIK